jgi:hypothetical protein
MLTVVLSAETDLKIAKKTDVFTEYFTVSGKKMSPPVVYDFYVSRKTP